MKLNSDSAAICGLFCGTCSSYIDGNCGGCLSQKCSCDCFNGFKDCAELHKVTRCYECIEFPCENLEDFSTKHIVNGICHHKDVIQDLQEMKNNGVEKWLESQTAKHTCTKCGKMIAWHKKGCSCK